MSNPTTQNPSNPQSSLLPTDHENASYEARLPRLLKLLEGLEYEHNLQDRILGDIQERRMELEADEQEAEAICDVINEARECIEGLITELKINKMTDAQ